MERRLQLVLQSGQLRESLADRARATAPLFAGAESLRRAGRWLASHPVVPAALAALLVWRRSRWVLRWGYRAFQWWRVLRRWMPDRR